MEQHSCRCLILNSGDDPCSRWFRIIKFTVYMALVVFELVSLSESLSKVMTNTTHMSFGSLDEATTVGQANIFFYFAAKVPNRANFARTSKVLEVPAVRRTRKYPRILQLIFF